MPMRNDVTANQPMLAVICEEVEDEWPAIWKVVQNNESWILAVIAADLPQPDYRARRAVDALSGGSTMSLREWMENYLE